MNIFNLIKAVLFTKEKLSFDIENENTVVPYMVNRWLSFYSPDIANIINITTNRFSSTFTDKNVYVNFLCNILPQKKSKIINYIKRKKEEKSEEDEKIGLLAKRLEISKREINEYILWHK
jgi:hypothetical protein